MIPRRAIINYNNRNSFYTILAFLKGRLNERETINWALKLGPEDALKRQALVDLINAPDAQQLNEPWKLAWRLIEENWNFPPFDEQDSHTQYTLKTRIEGGDRTGSLINAITEFIAPKLKIEKFSESHLKYRTLPRRVTKIEHLFSISLASGKFHEPDTFGIDAITNASFLFSLAQSLDSAVLYGLDIAKRLGWDAEHLWQLGQLHRVYYIPQSERPHDEHEPDEFNDGIAPSVKMLHTVVARLVTIDFDSARLFIQRWKSSSSAIYLRLWAAMARNPELASNEELVNFLLIIKDEYFWNKTYYPEISEVRAKRFRSLSLQEKQEVIKRIKKGPPRSHWSRKATKEQVKEYSLYSVASELYRIRLAGGQLADSEEAFLAQLIVRFPEIAEITTVEADFYKVPQARWVAPNPDNQFDLLSGKDRLTALEYALSRERSAWGERFSNRAADWIRDKLNYLRVLEDFCLLDPKDIKYPNVWEQFGWAHSIPTDNASSEDAPVRDPQLESEKVEALLLHLDSASLKKAIDGVSQWISVWSFHLKDTLNSVALWDKVWPIAVQATNALQPNDEEPDLNTVGKPDKSEPMDLDTLNTPAGKLTNLFFQKCPNNSVGSTKFNSRSIVRKMANQIVDAPGRSGLIGKHRMIEQINYFIHLDPAWTRTNLIGPLLEDGKSSLPLWRAIARRTQFKDVLQYIGDQLLVRVQDDRLGRPTRHSLLFSLIIECLISLYEHRDSVIAFPQVQQMLRNLDDESRAHGLQTLQRFVSQKNEKPSDTPEKRFRTAVVPFLQDVWPQETSLATPGSSKALSALPAASGSAFAEAVNVIERFLVPFPCWSIHDYGLHGLKDGNPKIAVINTARKVKAFLTLLDLTIGTAESAIIPHDLAGVLEHLRKVSPDISESYAFRRLSTAARRT